MKDIYKSWVDFGIDGFRIDTVKHVNMEFWQKFSPAILAQAKAIGNDDFFMFGEVYDGNPAFMSQYTTTGKLPATLDFGFQGAALGFAQGKATTGLRDLFAGDDYYTDTDSNAYELPTFLGNHDMGRVGMMLKTGGAHRRTTCSTGTELANSLMFLTRGQPVVYYGDEQGFIGDGGGDKDARQDMFATKVAAVQRRRRHRTGDARAARTATTPRAPLYQQISAARRRCARPTRRSPTARRSTATPPTAPASTRSAASTRATRREYVVVANNATTAKTATFATYSAADELRARCSAPAADLRVRPGRPGRPSPSPPLSVAVWKARAGDGHSARSHRRSTSTLAAAPAASSAAAPRSAPRSPSNAFAQVTFAYRPVGHDRLDAARHRRQRAVPRLPRRHRAGQGHPASSTARSPRTSAATSRRPRPTASSATPHPAGGGGGGGGRSGHPARQRQRPGQPQLRDGLPGRLAAGLRRRRS